MSFKFSIEKTDEIKSAKIYCLEGVMEEGSMSVGDMGKVDIAGKEFFLKIQSAVLINRNKRCELQKKFTVAIEKPDCDLKELEGHTFLSF